MPNALTSTGLTVATQAELVATLTAGYQSIYGADINLASNTPDGQMMNIFIQAILDVEELILSVYNSFNPDTAVGAVLDQRVAINGIQRQVGTFTVTNVSITVSQIINLYGLDQTAQPAFTVADNAGNQWQLQTTVNAVSVGTHVYSFQAAVAGAQLTISNTITVPITIVLGVTGINNPTTYTTLGINEESDTLLRIRRLQSVSLASQGYLSGLLAALQNISGVTAAYVYENTGGTTNSDGVPGHSIWVIVGGSPAAASVASAIYTKRNAGTGMYGNTTYTLTQVDGSTFTVYWDSVVTASVFVFFTATSLNGTTPPNIAAIRSVLPTTYVPSVNAELNVNQLATQVQAIDPNTLVTGAGFSLGTSQQLSFSSPSVSGTFVLLYNGSTSAAINYNDSSTTIQVKLQAITGLSAATVTGSIASLLTFNLTAVPLIAGLLTVTSNSLLATGSVPVTVSYSLPVSNTLFSPTKRSQLVVSSPNVVITAMRLTAPATSVTRTTGQTYTALGGYGAYVYSLSTNTSGGSINSSTGVYVSGPSPGVDVVLATDALNNTVTSSVTVV